MEKKFLELPPLKRFRFMQQENSPPNSSYCLPAKKRKESRSPPPLSVIPTDSPAICLPAKKRIWAFQSDQISHKPLSLFDLNLEYDPKSDEQHPKAAPEIEESEEKKISESEAIEHLNEEEEDDDDGVLCSVCQSTDGDPSDPIVFCDGCDLMVHATCYGKPLSDGVPDGDWFCSQCLISQRSSPDDDTNTKNLSCCLCPVAGGAMKPTNDGRWAHLVCSLFVPEVFFSDPDGREGIDCSEVPARRWGRKCYLCKSKNGCAIDCSEMKCNLGFHVTCGLREDLSIEYQEGKNRRSSVVAGFCKTHTELWKKQQMTGKFKIVAEKDEHK